MKGNNKHAYLIEHVEKGWTTIIIYMAERVKCIESQRFYISPRIIESPTHLFIHQVEITSINLTNEYLY